MTEHERAALEYGAQQKPSELAWLDATLVQTPANGGRVLEIGSWKGGMLWWLRQAFQPSLLASVDLTAQPLADVSIVGDSHEPATFSRVAEIAPFDLIFIDGDHSAAGVRRDWHLYSGLAAAGGVVCLHDIVPHRPELLCHVDELWRELVASPLRTVELVVPGPPEGCGIGVVFLP